jgi:hypothetical protein
LVIRIVHYNPLISKVRIDIHDTILSSVQSKIPKLYLFCSLKNSTRGSRA